MREGLFSLKTKYNLEQKVKKNEVGIKMVLGHFGNLQFRQPTKMTRRGKEPSKRVNLWNTVTGEGWEKCTGMWLASWWNDLAPKVGIIWEVVLQTLKVY